MRLWEAGRQQHLVVHTRFGRRHLQRLADRYNAYYQAGNRGYEKSNLEPWAGARETEGEHGAGRGEDRRPEDAYESGFALQHLTDYDLTGQSEMCQRGGELRPVPIIAVRIVMMDHLAGGLTQHVGVMVIQNHDHRPK